MVRPQDVIKKIIKGVLSKLNLKLIRTGKNQFGISYLDDIKTIFTKKNLLDKEIVIFDVGSNVGQTIEVYESLFSNTLIHAFEPSPRVFEMLKTKTSRYKNLIMNNVGVGSVEGSIQFFENINSDMSSFLQQSSGSWGEVNNIQNVNVITLDDYAERNKIERIDLLKIDTQGYDFEVLKGAKRLLSEKRIGLIQLEIILDDIYKSQPRMDKILEYLFDINYKLVAFYNFHNVDIAARWTDALFVKD